MEERKILLEEQLAQARTPLPNPNTIGLVTQTNPKSSTRVIMDRKKNIFPSYDESDGTSDDEDYTMTPHITPEQAQNIKVPVKYMDGRVEEVSICQDYILGDVGIMQKNMTNWGIRNGRPVILDYAQQPTKKLSNRKS